MIDFDPLVLVARVARTLEDLAVRYVLGGSLASTIMGEPRATMDIDLVVDLEPAVLDEWIAALGSEFVVDDAWARDEVARRGSFQILHQPSLMRIDVFVPPWEGVHLWKWQQRRRLVLDPASGDGIDVTGPEGIVIQTLSWFRAGGDVSDRQWRDVLGVLKAQAGTIDVTELDRWATTLGLTELLANALRQAGVAR